MDEGQEPRGGAVTQQGIAHLFKLSDVLLERDLATLGEEVLLAMALSGIGCWRLRMPELTLQATSICRSLYGRSPYDAFYFDDMLGAVHIDEREEFHALIDRAMKDGTRFDMEHRVVLPDARIHWIAVRGQTICEQTSQQRSLIGTVQDVTHRRFEEQRREFAARELNHRAKNSFMLTQAVIAQTIRSAKSIREIATMLDLRLAALAAANDLLLGSTSQSAAIVDVLRRVLMPFGFEAVRQFRWAGPEVSLPPRVVASLSFGLHELATNACKYGALSCAEGEVRLVWSVVDARLRLTWEERSGPPVTPPLRVGFGTKLIERCLGLDVGGVTAIEYRPEGVYFTAEVPLDSPVEAKEIDLALKCHTHENR